MTLATRLDAPEEAGAAMTVTPPLLADSVVVAGAAVTVLKVPEDDEVGARPMMASVPSVTVVTGASEDDDWAATRPTRAAKRVENCMAARSVEVAEIGRSTAGVGEPTRKRVWRVVERMWQT